MKNKKATRTQARTETRTQAPIVTPIRTRTQPPAETPVNTPVETLIPTPISTELPVLSQIQKGRATMEKAYNDFVTFGQDNIDAFVRANAAFTRGFEQISKNFVALATKSVEDAVEAGKKIAGSKSVAEALELQTRFATDSIESLISEGKKVQDLSTSLVKEVTGPLTERFKATVANGAAVAQNAANVVVSNVTRATKQAA